MSEEMTTAERLQEVRRAISAILNTGQTYTIGNRSLTRANITELRRLEADLAARAREEAAQNAPLMPDTYVACFMGR